MTMFKARGDKAAIARLLRTIADDWETGECVMFSVAPEPNDVLRLSLRYASGNIPEWPGLERVEVAIKNDDKETVK